jgi:type VI protein secretion system component Hcp
MLTALLLTMIAFGGKAQVSMKINATQIQLISFSDSGATSLNGSRESRPASSITVKMMFDQGVNTWHQNFLNGQNLPQVQFLFTSRNTNPNTPKYTVQAEQVVITGFKIYTLDNNPNLYAEMVLSARSVAYTYSSANTTH